MWNSIVVTDRNRGLYGALVHEQLRKRRAHFHEKLGWDVPRSQLIEQDQYDRAETVYILIEKDGALAAYTRLLPTTARAMYGQSAFSYMARDASLGLLPGIPPHILGGAEPLESDAIWEASRLEATGRTSLKLLLHAMGDFGREAGLEEIVTFTRRSFVKITGSLGYDVSVIGPDVDYGGKPYCAFRANVIRGRAQGTPAPSELKLAG